MVILDFAGARNQKICWGQSRKNMSGQMLKKQAGASAKKTSGTLNEKLKKAAAAEGGGNLFELAAEGRHSLSVPLVF